MLTAVYHSGIIKEGIHIRNVIEWLCEDHM